MGRSTQSSWRMVGVVVALGMLAAGCRPESTAEKDGGTPVADAGTPPDAAGTAGDAAVPEPDAGAPADAAVMDWDAALPPRDAGAAWDAGPPMADAAVSADAAGHAPDAARVPPDAGTPVDAGSALDAGGVADAARWDSGCVPECPLGHAGCADSTSRTECVVDALGCAVWGPPQACDGGEACNAGTCVPACAPEDTRCLDGTRLQTCTLGQVATQVCDFGCDGVAKACRACVPGAWQCRARSSGGFSLESCPTGSAWQLRNVCQECACAEASSVVMQCRYSSNDQPTSCTLCTPDGLGCTP